MRWSKDAHFMEALYVVFLAFCLVVLSSCAHDPALQKKIQSEADALPALTSQERADDAQKTFAQASVTDAQREKLDQIALTAKADLQNIREENQKLRLLLVRQLVNPKATDREVDAIKVRILETDQQSNKRWLSALDDAQKVLGRKNEEDMKYYRAFQDDPVKAETEIGLPRAK